MQNNYIICMYFSLVNLIIFGIIIYIIMFCAYLYCTLVTYKCVGASHVELKRLTVE